MTLIVLQDENDLLRAKLNEMTKQAQLDGVEVEQSRRFEREYQSRLSALTEAENAVRSREAALGKNANCDAEGVCEMKRQNDELRLEVSSLRNHLQATSQLNMIREFNSNRYSRQLTSRRHTPTSGRPLRIE